MSVVDTFTILFTGDNAPLKAKIKDTEQSVENLKKKMGNWDGEKEALKKAEQALAGYQKQLKQSEEGSKELGLSFLNLATAGVAALSAVGILNKLKDGALSAINFNAEIEKQSRLTELSADEISAWGGAVAAAGGDAAGFSAWLAKLNEQYSEAGLGGRIKNVLPNLIQLADQFKHLKDIGEHGQALALGEKLGVTPDMVLLLEKGSDEVAKMVAQQEKLAPLTKKNAEAAQAFAVAQKNLSRSSTALFTDLEPVLEGFLKFFEIFIGGMRDTVSVIKDIATGNWKHLLTAKMGGGTADNIAPPPLPSLQQHAQSNKNDSIAFWLRNGYSPAQAAALVANEQRESNFNSSAVGDGGRARGIFQWHPDRQSAILKGTGIDVRSASHDDQLKAALWELNHTESRANDLLRRSNDASDAAGVLSRYGLRPADANGEAAVRGNLARGTYAEIMQSMMAEGKGAIGTADSSQFGRAGPVAGKEVNMRIDNITINTQATDADGIARSLNDSLAQQYRTTAGNADDGIQY